MVSAIVLLLLAGIFGGFIGYWKGYYCGQSDLVSEAVLVQRAEWYLDKNNDKQWRWAQPPARGEKEGEDVR